MLRQHFQVLHCNATIAPYGYDYLKVTLSKVVVLNIMANCWLRSHVRKRVTKHSLSTHIQCHMPILNICNFILSHKPHTNNSHLSNALNSTAPPSPFTPLRSPSYDDEPIERTGPLQNSPMQIWSRSPTAPHIGASCPSDCHSL